MALLTVGANAIKNLNAWPTTLALNFNFKPFASPIHKTLRICRCSLVNEQQASFTEQEEQLINALIGIQGRGRTASPRQLIEVEQAVQVLEGQDGVRDPTSYDLIEVRWQLMFTTRPGTTSPFQVSPSSIGISSSLSNDTLFIGCREHLLGLTFLAYFKRQQYQSKMENESSFGSTEQPFLLNFYHLRYHIQSHLDFLEMKLRAGWTLRICLILEISASQEEIRYWAIPVGLILFVLANFSLLNFNSFSPRASILSFNSIPQLLPRIPNPRSSSIPNSCSFESCSIPRSSFSSPTTTTTFVLQKKTDPRQTLLAAISTGTAIDEFLSLRKSVAKDEPVLLEGEWQMIWSSQVETDSWLENAGNGLMGSQIVKNGQMKFLVNNLPGISFSMIGNFVKSGTKTYDVTMDDAALIGGPFGYPLEMETKINMELL
ncbi:putative plastid-lipid-associated protein 12 [Hibiscus syriacus]|uniref:Plastid-lipid-associated protein 12 n=1 Tax=Hibiscus syriacus TaxID=106335 RepID=A0A6A3A0D9_HIBSY|nr:putative plastid-lipid-associated protein 12 [Hibiscus syriacus]